MLKIQFLLSTNDVCIFLAFVQNNAITDQLHNQKSELLNDVKKLHVQNQ